MDRVTPTLRPAGSAQGFHQWRDLLFLHWEVDAALLRPVVPEGLEIDTFEGKAYVGLVPFTMQGIRPWRFLPAMPFVSAFHETNVRTYVYRKGPDGACDPGVWFFSLDAANALAVKVARSFWHLPYFKAKMSLSKSVGNGALTGVRYRSVRRWPEPTPATSDIECEVHEPASVSLDGSLQHFLAERYFLYSADSKGRLFRGQVHHPPYPLFRASLKRCEETMVQAAQVQTGPMLDLVLYSPGVDVETFALAPVST